jgi:hypothetical protein
MGGDPQDLPNVAAGQAGEIQIGREQRGQLGAGVHGGGRRDEVGTNANRRMSSIEPSGVSRQPEMQAGEHGAVHPDAAGVPAWPTTMRTDMKRSSGWTETSVSVAVLVGAMLVVMWAQRPAGCTMPVESARHLVLTRETDREHLSRDRAEASRIEQRYKQSGEVSAQQQSACAAGLVQQIIATHGVTPEQASPGALQP